MQGLTMSEVIKITPKCERCFAVLRYYNIGFDQGYVCDRCGATYETYRKDGTQRDTERRDNAK